MMSDAAIWFFDGFAAGALAVFIVSYRLLKIDKVELTRREQEVMDVTSELAKERAIPKKRPRSTPIWPPRGQA